MTSQSDFTRMLELLSPSSRGAYSYPDPRRGALDVKMSLGGRDEETALWDAWVGAHRGALALDAGCGLGVHTTRLRGRFDHVLSVDGDPDRLEVARAAWGEGDAHAFRCVRLDDAVLDDERFRNRFSFIQCMQVLGHMSVAAQPAVLRRLAAMLDGSAPLLLAIPFTHDVSDEFCKTVLGPEGMGDGIRIPVGEFESLTRASTPGVLPVHHFSVAGVQRLVRSAGMKVVRMQVYNEVGPTAPNRADVMVLLERA